MKILSTLAVRGVLLATSKAYESRTGQNLDFDFAATLQLKEKINHGARGDIVILTANAIDEFCEQQVLQRNSAIDLVSSDIALAVAANAAPPDVSNVDALVQSLLAARSVAYSKQGASGVYFAGLLKRLGIDEAINKNATVIPEGLTGEKLLSAEADIAVQQLSELKQVSGINIFSKLPDAVQESTIFTAALFNEPNNKDAANAWLDFLCSTEVLDLFAEQGLTPIGIRRHK